MRSLLLVWVLWCVPVLATDRPIIGILFQEPNKAINDLVPHSVGYIAASYVRAIQATGARVVPVQLNRTRDYYRSIISSVNGLLFPGGNTWFYGHKGGYADSGDLLFQEAIALNNRGVHFPVIGICLGFELLLFLDNMREEYRSFCSSKNVSLPLVMKPDYNTSKLFKGASSDLINILSNESVTFNQHGFCVTEQNLTLTSLSDKWRVLTTNWDTSSKQEFISIVESKKYPFVGLQFHPEKNPFEWRKDLAIPHFPNAIRASRFFYDWFVSEARQNNNSFAKASDEEDSLIYNYPTFNSKGVLVFDEIYIHSNSLPLHAGYTESSSSYSSNICYFILILSLLLSQMVALPIFY